MVCVVCFEGSLNDCSSKNNFKPISFVEHKMKFSYSSFPKGSAKSSSRKDRKPRVLKSHYSGKGQTEFFDLLIILYSSELVAQESVKLFNKLFF